MEIHYFRKNNMNNQSFRVGILGAGHIAATVADTVSRMPDACLYAVASRSLERAQEFQNKWNAERAYGSYEELMSDPAVDLIYIATPHSHHYEQARACLLHGKAVLCEKTFTANKHQAEELVKLSRERNLFLGEAIWTRYMPFSKEICRLTHSGVIGRPRMLTANLGYPIEDKERIRKPELCGGALLDLGVYPINLAFMLFGNAPERIVSCCTKNELGVDMQNSMTFIYPQGEMAVMQTTACCANDRMGVISGDKGYLVIDNINNPQQMVAYDENHEQSAVYTCPPQITGYEYEVRAAMQAIRDGKVEPEDMPHIETLRIMGLLDQLRQEWGVVFPADIC